MQGPAEDAGILHLGTWEGERYGVVIAHESHNHPSQVVPFEGAATGVGGIVRDVLCMGAEVIGIADPLRFGRLDDPHCRYVAQSVVDGIAAYGNAIGVPNLGGDVYIDESFDDNVLVNVVALGLIKETEIIHSHAPPNAIGYDIVLVGKATDRSGFGGASFSSLTLDDADAEANKGAVQVPDPFLKNVIMRASYRVFAELRRLGIEAGYKDLGAGGFAGCSAELCAAGGVGAEVELDRVLGLASRSAAGGDRDRRDARAAVLDRAAVVHAAAARDLQRRVFAAAHLARRGRGDRRQSRRRFALRRAASRRGRDGRRSRLPHRRRALQPAVHDRVAESAAPTARPMRRRSPMPARALDALLAHRDVCSRRSIFERYDGVVRGTTAMAPGVADAGVICPIPGAPLGVALSVAGNPRYGKCDPQLAAEHAVLEAVRNVVAVGARPLGLTDCLNFGDPTVPEHLGAMVAAIDGLSYAARRLGTPYVSGNVSLYNQSKSGRTVAPSPIVACVGAIRRYRADARRWRSSAPDSPVYFIGAPETRVGGSVYADLLGITDARCRRSTTAASRARSRSLLTAYAGESRPRRARRLRRRRARRAREDGVRDARRRAARRAPRCHRRSTAAAGTAAFARSVRLSSSKSPTRRSFSRSRARSASRSCDSATTTAAYEFAFGDGIVRSLDALYETWSAPLRDFYAPAAAAGAA